MKRFGLSFKLIIVLFSCFFFASKAYNTGLRYQLRRSRIARSGIRVKDVNKMLSNSGSTNSLRIYRLQCKESQEKSEDEPKEAADEKKEEQDEVGDNEGGSIEGDSETSEDNEEDTSASENNEEDKDSNDDGGKEKEEQLTPEAKAIKEAEDTLRKQLNDLESTLRSERVNLSKTKDKKDMSGKI